MTDNRFDLKKIIHEIISFESLLMIFSAVILTTVISLQKPMESLYPYILQINSLEIPGFRIFGWMFNQIILFLFLPVIFLLIFKRKPRNFGFSIKGIKKFWWVLLGCAILIIGAMYFVSGLDSFKQMYPMYQYGKYDVKLLIIYEVVFLIYLFSWEFFFRGFMLFGLEKRFGNYAILIQMIPFVLMHFSKPPMEIYSSIIGGILLGVIALKTRSFIPCWILHLLFSLPLDFFVYFRIN